MVVSNTGTGHETESLEPDYGSVRVSASAVPRTPSFLSCEKTGTSIMMQRQTGRRINLSKSVGGTTP